MKLILLSHPLPLLIAVGSLSLSFGRAAAAAEAVPGCPNLMGWSEGLIQYQKPDSPFPTQDTKNLPTPDCFFHEWSWEAFVWATTLDPTSSVPRFMTLPTLDDLLAPEGKPLTKGPGAKLVLGARSLRPHGAPGFSEGAGAFVEADGNVMVSRNGYPVYASVHMNQSYFNTAKLNLIATGGYNTQPADSYFEVGAAVFKATWMRLDPGEAPPKGAYTTQAEVPVLHVLRTTNNYTVVPTGQTATATVALVGLHVVGYTENHPEFLWGTFEHNLNTPETPDGTFSTSGSDPNNYTFYTANTSYAQVDQPNPPSQGQSYTPPQLWFDPATQKFTPATNAVQENKTGGENQPGGPENIKTLNGQAQSFLAGESTAQAVFANYHLVGTVWMLPNTYAFPPVGPAGGNPLTLNQNNAVGSIVLANTTAETFVVPSPNLTQTNCFLCHNASSYNFQTPPPPQLASRRIAISHVLGVGTSYAVPNLLNVPITNPAPRAPSAK